MIDIDEFKKLIVLELQKNIVIRCEKGKHKFVPVGDGTLDVKCGIKAMRATIKIK